MDEPLHHELDQWKVPFRLDQADVIATYGGEIGEVRFELSLPMTANFIDSQIGLLSVKVDRLQPLNRPFGVLYGSASDFDAAVGDVTQRFGSPADADTADTARWKMGTLSEVVVTRTSDGCTLRIAPNFQRPHTEQELLAIAAFQEVAALGSSAFGWTEVDGKRWLMKHDGRRFVVLVDPDDVDHLRLTEYSKGRGPAHSTLSYVIDGNYHGIGAEGPGELVDAAKELREQLGMELETISSVSA